MAAVAVGVRPNIRIEIQNTNAKSEPMELDNDEKEAEGDIEDGEISDKNDENLQPQLQSNKLLGLSADLLSSEYANEGVHQFSLMQMENGFPVDEMPKLFNSLGITSDNADNVRFDALHMKGAGNMVLDDIFKYFHNYEPGFVEWISTGCCNVVFHDNLTAAKALYFTSKAIKRASETGRSILLIKKEREVELQGEDMVVLSNNDDDTVNASDIPLPIPEGHWRLGIEHPKANCIFLRFALQTDRKQPRLEENNFGGIGLISESRKRKIKGIFERNRDIHRIDEASVKNPWGDLAENWFTNESIEEPPIVTYKPVIKQEVIETLKYDVLNRLGIKRKNELNIGSDQENKKGKTVRMRMYADEEEAKINRKKRLEAVKMFTEDRTQVVPDLRNIIRTANRTKKESESDHQSEDSDLGTKLKNRLKKRNYRNSRLENERELTPYREEIRLQALQTQRREEARKAREDNKQVRERERQLKNFRNKSPPLPKNRPPSRHKNEPLSNKNNSSRQTYSKSKYKNRMHSDRHEEKRHRTQRRSHSKENKTKSKVEVVAKTRSKPAVASTVWSRIDNTKKERLKTASDRLQRDSSANSESSSESSSSSSSTTSTSSIHSSSESEDANDEVVEQAAQAILKRIDRPGFKSSSTQSAPVTHYKKSPLRIEISNDHFRK